MFDSIMMVEMRGEKVRCEKEEVRGGEGLGLSAHITCIDSDGDGVELLEDRI